MKRDRVKNKYGFTLVELLTTLAVIGVLLGLLIPALNQVSKFAANVKQKAQFHAIGTALEAFRNDYGDYPPSQWDTGKYGSYCASQRLAEALVGRDGLGFHPNSIWHETGVDGGAKSLYRDHASFGADYPTDIEKQNNLVSRKGPYLELENANAVKLSAIYDPAMLAITHFPDTYILADMYKQVKHRTTGKQIGMPILYYRANKLKIGNEPDRALSNNWNDNTYNLEDSLYNGFGLIQIPSPSGQSHFNGGVVANASAFYSAIANPNFTSPPRPYRAESFILHSAGPDGLYGTTDDVFNFKTEK